MSRQNVVCRDLPILELDTVSICGENLQADTFFVMTSQISDGVIKPNKDIFLIILV